MRRLIQSVARLPLQKKADGHILTSANVCLGVMAGVNSIIQTQKRNGQKKAKNVMSGNALIVLLASWLI
ncbi:MAG: hypothetical protein ACXAEN_24080 [Candidatus Thorarchaeota archaeon]